MQRYAGFLGIAIWCVVPFIAAAQAPTPTQKAATVGEEGGRHPSDAGKKDTPKTAEKLEQLIVEAFKNNPDIRVAETKLRLAEAEAARARLKLISEIAGLQADIETAQAVAEEGKKRYDRAKLLFEKKVIPLEDFEAAFATYVKLKADLASHQTKLPYLLGRNTAGGDSASLRIYDIYRSTLEQKNATAALKAHETAKLPISDEEFARRISLDILGRTTTAEEMKKFLAIPARDRREKWISQAIEEGQASGAVKWLNKVYAASIPESPLAEKLRKALDATTKLDVDTIGVGEAFQFVREEALPGINLIVRAKMKKETVAIRLRSPVPVGAMLQFLEDELGVVFLLRDYGVVVVSAEERLPPDAVRVVDFWKQGAPSKNK